MASSHRDSEGVTVKLAQAWLAALVAVAMALGTVGSVAAQGPTEPATAGIEVTVWRRVSNPSLLYLSTRPEGGSWRTQNTALDMSALSSSGRFHQSNAVTVSVPLPGGETATVEVTVWRRVSNPSLLYLSTRPEGGSWHTLNAALDMSQRSDSGRFHQSNPVLVDVPLPDLPPADPSGPDRTACVIDEAMAAKVIASTVQVITPTGTGSAFYVGASEFVTAGHVVDNNPSSIRLRNADISISARLIGFYPFESGDVAILSASAPSMTALTWAGVLAPGATIAVVGYPEGLGVSASITQGIVSRLFTQQGVSYLQTDSAVSPGNSGGPLVDACGRVAGVVSSSFVGERGSEGLHFAIAEPALARLLQRIRTGQSPPPAESPPSAEAGEPTFWDINEFINSVSQDWGPTITALNGLIEQWDIIRDYEDPPSERLAENARKRRDLSQAMVTTLESLRSDPATRNTTASRYLERAIGYWAAGVTDDEALERYALATATWAAVLRARASQAGAWASYTSARCDLWRLQGYSNAGDTCRDVAGAEAAADEAETAAEAREAWEHVDSLIHSVLEHWRPVTLWETVIPADNRPSQQGAEIARGLRDLAQAMVTRLDALRSAPGARDVSARRYLEAAITYWDAASITARRAEQYALAQVPLSSLLQAQDARDTARASYDAATCDLWRQQRYSNAQDICTATGQ